MSGNESKPDTPDKCPKCLRNSVAGLVDGMCVYCWRDRFDGQLVVKDAEIVKLRQENYGLQDDWKTISDQNDECHQPAANYELLLARLKGVPTNHGDCPVAKKLDDQDAEIEELTETVAGYQRENNRVNLISQKTYRDITALELANEGLKVIVGALAREVGYQHAAIADKRTPLAEGDAATITLPDQSRWIVPREIADELAPLRRLAAALDDEGLAQRIIAQARNGLTHYPELRAVADYREALREARDKEPTT